MEWETLGGNLRLATDADFHFGTDAVILAHFAAPHKAGETVCDLGTGCGVIPFLLMRHTPAPRHILGVDIQEEAIRLCRLSAQKNRLSAISFLQADWRLPAAIAPAGSCDRVICNPPYFPPGSGRASASPARQLARTEAGDTLTDVARAAAFLLKTGGRFYLCHRPERLTDLLCTLRQHRLEPKRLQTVQQKAGQAPWLLLIEAVKGAHPGLVLPEPWSLEDEQGKTPLYHKIYELYH